VGAELYGGNRETDMAKLIVTFKFCTFAQKIKDVTLGMPNKQMDE